LASPLFDFYSKNEPRRLLHQSLLKMMKESPSERKELLVEAW
jgi:hypothetical protein